MAFTKYDALIEKGYDDLPEGDVSSFEVTQIAQGKLVNLEKKLRSFISPPDGFTYLDS